MDVARKALILCRLIGKKLELSDIQLESLYPKEMQDFSVEEFLSNLSSLDVEFKRKIEEAKQENKVLRYVASVSRKGCGVGLQAVEKNSDIGSLQGPDNLIVIRTKRYRQNPLVIKGPGAGVEVTAAGVFGDLVEIAKRV